MKFRKIISSATFLVLSQSIVCEAVTISVNAIDVGWYDVNGYTLSNNVYNYSIGESVSDGVELRNYFAFDLSMISGYIETATIRAYLMSDYVTSSPTYVSPDSTETWALYEASNSIDDMLNDTSSVDVFNDLGDGSTFGSQAVSAIDMGNYIEVAFNADGITSLNSSGGLFATGGALTSLSSTEGESIFGWSHVDPRVEILLSGDLSITAELPGSLLSLPGNGAGTVPIPASIWLFLSGLIGLVGLSRKKIS